MDRLTGFVLCKWIVEDATRGTEELSSDELDDDFAFFVGFATAEALVAPQQLEPLVFVSFRLWLVRLRTKLPEPSRQLTVNRRDS